MIDFDPGPLLLPELFNIHSHSAKTLGVAHPRHTVNLKGIQESHVDQL
jgi:hypothetical protein